MNIRINGKVEAVADAANIAGLVAARALAPSKIVVEHNKRIVSAEEWARIELKDDDVIEIVSFVGGG